MSVQISRIEKEDQDIILEIASRFWGDDTMVVHNDVYHLAEVDGLKAVVDNRIIGLLHYQIRGGECEILTLASLCEGQGIGSALIEAVTIIAKENQCHLLCLITTNDNLHALGFYQRRGFHLAALYPNQVNRARKLKPTIPELGENNIPIRDEIRLEKQLSTTANENVPGEKSIST